MKNQINLIKFSSRAVFWSSPIRKARFFHYRLKTQIAGVTITSTEKFRKYMLKDMMVATKHMFLVFEKI